VSDFSKKAMDGVLPLKVLEKRTSRKNTRCVFRASAGRPPNALRG
jgi:hypothetical protein